VRAPFRLSASFPSTSRLGESSGSARRASLDSRAAYIVAAAGRRRLARVGQKRVVGEAAGPARLMGGDHRGLETRCWASLSENLPPGVTTSAPAVGGYRTARNREYPIRFTDYAGSTCVCPARSIYVASVGGMICACRAACSRSVAVSPLSVDHHLDRTNQFRVIHWLQTSMWFWPLVCIGAGIALSMISVAVDHAFNGASRAAKVRPIRRQ
jgi:hypothetical protein